MLIIIAYWINYIFEFQLLLSYIKLCDIRYWISVSVLGIRFQIININRVKKTHRFRLWSSWVFLNILARDVLTCLLLILFSHKMKLWKQMWCIEYRSWPNSNIGQGSWWVIPTKVLIGCIIVPSNMIQLGSIQEWNLSMPQGRLDGRMDGQMLPNH